MRGQFLQGPATKAVVDVTVDVGEEGEGRYSDHDNDNGREKGTMRLRWEEECRDQQKLGSRAGAVSEACAPVLGCLRMNLPQQRG